MPAEQRRLESTLGFELRLHLGDVLGAQGRGAERQTLLDEALLLLADLPSLAPDRVRNLFAQAGETLLAAHDPVAAAARAEQLASRLPGDGGALYLAAVLLARCASVSGIDEADAFAERAVACLRDALANGFRPVGDLHDVSEFAVLEGRADFQAALRKR